MTEEEVGTTVTRVPRPPVPPPDPSDLADPDLKGLLEGAEALGRREPRAGPWLFARGDSLFKVHDLGGLDKLTRKRALAEASLQLAFHEVPGVVAATAVSEEGSWLVLEYRRQGEDLHQHLETRSASGKGLPSSAYAELLAGAARALDALHERGIVHGDLRPDSLVLEGERLLVGDFPVPSLENTIELDPYRAPERFAGERGPSIDQYALGVIARETLTGPGSPPLTEPVHRVLQRATARRPADRFATIAEFGKALVVAVDEETPRTLSERVAGLSPAKRNALTPTAIAAVAAAVITTAKAPGSSEIPALVVIATLLALVVLPGLVFCVVAVASWLRGNRQFLSVRLASNPRVQFLLFLLLVAAQVGRDDAFSLVLDALMIAYGGSALLAPARPLSGSWLVRLLAIWDRRRIWHTWRRRLVATGAALLAVAAVAAPTTAKVIWDSFEFPSESAADFSPLVPVWNLRLAFAKDDADFACEQVLTVAAARDGQLCRRLAHLAATIQRRDPIAGWRHEFGVRGGFEAFSVQELPPLPNHRYWKLLTPDGQEAGAIYTRGRNGTQMIALLGRRPATGDFRRQRSLWLYELVWNGREWRIAEYRACELVAPGGGKRPADCDIVSDASEAELRAALSGQRKSEERR